MKETVYISFPMNVEVNDKKINLGMAGSIWCADKHMLARIKAINLINIGDTPSRRIVISVLKVVELIASEYPEITVCNVGEPDFILSYKKPKKNDAVWQFLKAAAVSVIVFCGGTFAIMAYGNDIDINSVLKAICKFITGDSDRNLWIIELCYCIGLTAGIIVFYNHLGRRKYSKDPTPLEVEMRLYEQDLDTAIINDSARRKKEEDVN